MVVFFKSTGMIMKRGDCRDLSNYFTALSNFLTLLYFFVFINVLINIDLPVLACSLLLYRQKII